MASLPVTSVHSLGAFPNFFQSCRTPTLSFVLCMPTTMCPAGSCLRTLHMLLPLPRFHSPRSLHGTTFLTGKFQLKCCFLGEACSDHSCKGISWSLFTMLTSSCYLFVPCLFFLPECWAHEGRNFVGLVYCHIPVSVIRAGR